MRLDAANPAARCDRADQLGSACGQLGVALALSAPQRSAGGGRWHVFYLACSEGDLAHGQPNGAADQAPSKVAPRTPRAARAANLIVQT